MPSESTIQRILEYVRGMKDVDPAVLRQGLEVARLHRRVEQEIENDLAGWGLTARQVEIMEALYHNGEGTMTPADLAEEVGLTRSAMTSVLDSLEGLGHTLRRPHPNDRRSITIVLTPTGRKFISLRLPERYRDIYRVVRTLSEKERMLLLRCYRKVLDALVTDGVAGRSR